MGGQVDALQGAHLSRLKGRDAAAMARCAMLDAEAVALSPPPLNCGSSPS